MPLYEEVSPLRKKFGPFHEEYKKMSYLCSTNQQTKNHIPMKRCFIIASLAFITLTGWAADNKGKVLAQTEGSITFAVDEGLKPRDVGRKTRYNGEQMAHLILQGENIRKEAFHIMATSFADAQNLNHSDKDAFYKTIVDAYANHKSIVLSPDIMWLLISQGFARYVNGHAEALRSQLVDHEGQKDLIIQSELDSTGATNWPKLVDDFSKQIESNTKGDIARTIVADFSTTSREEHVASLITLMESMKAYFRYHEVAMGCGIPSITLKGTPDDWRKVLDKTKRLAPYGLSEWTKSLEPILAEFISAAEGQPNQKFWKDIVKKHRVKKLEKSGGCGPDMTTKFDGWLLKFFPDENGKTFKKVSYDIHMPSERVRVRFIRHVIDPDSGEEMYQIQMELIAGFIGAEEDTTTNTVTPKIGWLVRQTEENEGVQSPKRK